MNRLPVADWAASVPASGITGTIPASQIGPIDLANVTWVGVAVNRYPVWNGTRFVPTAISSSGSSGTTIKAGDQPAFAVRRRPPGQPSNEYENVWQRFEANVKLFGATGNGGTSDLVAVNFSINAVNAAGGGCLYFPAGRYVLAGGLNQITVPCLIRGDGIGVSTLLMGGEDGPYFNAGTASTWFGCERFSVEDSDIGLTFSGGKIDATQVAIECSGIGISLSGSSEGWVDSSLFLSTGTATAISGDANNVELSGIRLLGDAQWRWGFEFTAGTAISIYDCYAANVLNSAVYMGTATTDSRVANLSFRDVLGANPVSNQGTNNYVNELFGLGGNTNTNFDNRKELLSVFSWNPGSTGPGYGWYDDFNIPGASLGDQVIYGAPYSFDPAVSVDARAVASDTVRISLLNFGTSSIDLSAGNWKLRVIN